MNNETSKSNQQITNFWQAYCRLIHKQLPQPDAWPFGSTPQMATELADLMIAGKKTATTSAYIADEDDYATIGQYDIVLDGYKRPVAVIQNVVSELMPYAQVSAEHAYHEGEGDRSLAYWRQAHEAFFREEGSRKGYQFNQQLTVSCEVFELRATRQSLSAEMGEE